MNFLKRWVLTRILKEVIPMDKLKGYKTLIVNGALFLTYLLAWDQITTVLPFLSPQVVATATTVVNVVLRFVTTSPVFDAEKK